MAETALEELPADILAELSAEELTEFEFAGSMILKGAKVFDPTTYGLPDLIILSHPNETKKELRARQEEAMQEVVQHIYAVKDGRQIWINLIPPILEFMVDMFYEYENRAIVWKPRGGGGSLCVALLIFLNLTYRHKSCTDMAGCLLPETLVDTDSGIKPVKDVKSGEFSYDKKGKKNRIKRVIKKEWSDGKAVLKLHGLPDMEFTPEHEILVVRDAYKRSKVAKLRFKRSEETWVEAKDLREGDAVGVCRPKMQCTADFSLAECRFFGYWLAEGDLCWVKTGEKTRSRSVRLHCSSEDIFLDDCQETIRQRFKRKPGFSNPTPREARIVFGHTELANWLEKALGYRSYGKKLPLDFITSLNYAQGLNLLAGYMMGDGSCAKDGRTGLSNEVIAFTVSKDLAYGMFNLGLALGFAPMVKPRRYESIQKIGPKGKPINRRDGWVIRFGGVDAEFLNDFIWKKKVNRKVRARRIFKTCDKVFYGVKEVEISSYTGPVYDLVMEDDSCFRSFGYTVHNSSEQAGVVYHYTKNFWDCKPSMAKAVLKGEPLATLTTLKNGVELKLATASEKSVRGKHKPGFIADESCTTDASQDKIVQAGMNTIFSEPGFYAVLVSTFHVPVGLYQEIWDDAEQRGFKRYKWNCFDSMKACKIGYEGGPQEYLDTDNYTKDIKKCVKPGSKGDTAICRNCYLTEIEHVVDPATGKIIGEQVLGCAGQARKSSGWTTYKEICLAKESNAGSDIFRVEHECRRPEVGGKIWPAPLLEEAFAHDLEDLAVYDDKDHYRLACGIDWGHSGETAMILGGKAPADIVLIDAAYYTRRQTATIIAKLDAWKEEYGMDIEVYADISHPFNNHDVNHAGYKVFPVDFNRWKEIGIGNIGKYLVFKRLKGHRQLVAHLLTQLLGYARDKSGKPLKKNDHGCDALICLMLKWLYNDEFGKSTEEKPGATVY